MALSNKELGNIIVRSRYKLSVVLMLLIYSSEAYSKILYTTYGYRSNVAMSIKTFIGILVLGLMVTRIKAAIPLILVCLCFLIGQLNIDPNFDIKVSINVIKYLFFIALLWFYQKLFFKTKNSLLLKSFIILVISNSILLIVGSMWDLSVFRSYLGDRFGYNGLLINSSTATYFYFTAFSVLLCQYGKSVIKNWVLYLVILSSLLVGTKSLVLVLLAFVFIYIILYNNTRHLAYFTALIILLGSLLFYYIFFNQELFNVIREDHGLISSILSFRDKLLVEEMWPFIKSKWGFSNYLFGGINDVTSRPQLALFDLFYYFGLFGAAVYLFQVWKLFRGTLVSFRGILVMSTLCVVVFFSDNFFSNASAAIYGVIIWESLKSNQKNVLINKNE